MPSRRGRRHPLVYYLSIDVDEKNVSRSCYRAVQREPTCSSRRVHPEKTRPSAAQCVLVDRDASYRSVLKGSVVGRSKLYVDHQGRLTRVESTALSAVESIADTTVA